MDRTSGEISNREVREFDEGLGRNYDDRLESDEDKPHSSIENVIPTEQLQNGIRTARSLWLRGWNGMKEQWKVVEESEPMNRAKEQWRIIDNSEQMMKVKEVTAPVVEKTVNGLNEVGHHVGVATQMGIKWTGERYEEAKPTLIDLREKAIGLTKDVQKKFVGEGGSSTGGGPPRVV